MVFEDSTSTLCLSSIINGYFYRYWPHATFVQDTFLANLFLIQIIQFKIRGPKGIKKVQFECFLVPTWWNFTPGSDWHKFQQNPIKWKKLWWNNQISFSDIELKKYLKLTLICKIWTLEENFADINVRPYPKVWNKPKITRLSQTVVEISWITI